MAFYGSRSKVARTSPSSSNDGGKQSKGREDLNYGKGPSGRRPNNPAPRATADSNSPWQNRQRETFQTGLDPNDPRWRGLQPRTSFDLITDATGAGDAGNQAFLDRYRQRWNAFADYPGFAEVAQQIAAAKASGDMRAMVAAAQRAKQLGQESNFVLQGGSPEVWQNRYDPNNNFRRPMSQIGYSHGPGSPDYPPTGGGGPYPGDPGSTASAASAGSGSASAGAMPRGQMAGMLQGLGSGLGGMAPAASTPSMASKLDALNARKVAQGMPAYLLDPNYVPGSRRR